MDKILFINTCVRQESRTLRLAKHLLARLDGEITEVSPDKCRPLDAEGLKRRDELLAKARLSAPEFEEAQRFARADIIVIAAPYWDLSFPAQLKIYTENITVCGITFVYTENGVPKGLCKAKKLYYVTSSGGPIVQNMGFEYISALASGFYGIKDIKFVSAEGLDIYGADVEGILEEAEQKADML